MPEKNRNFVELNKPLKLPPPGWYLRSGVDEEFSISNISRNATIDDIVMDLPILRQAILKKYTSFNKVVF